MIEANTGSNEPQRQRSLDEIIDNMPTPTDVAGTFALFLALEGKAMEDGQSTPEQSAAALRAVFGTDQAV